MRSLRRVDSHRSCLFLVGFLLLTAAWVARPAYAQDVVVRPVRADGFSLFIPVEFNPYGLWLTGSATSSAGAVTAFRGDYLGLVRGGGAPLVTLPGDNGVGTSVSGAGHVSGETGAVAAVWYYTSPTSFIAFTLSPIDGFFTGVVRITDGDRFLLHVRQNGTGALAASYLGRLDPQTGALNLAQSPSDATTLTWFWDIAGSSVVGAIYSRAVSGSRFPFRARLVNGVLTPLQVQLPAGFTQGTLGGLFATDDDGNAAGDWRAVGGAFEAGLVFNDGTSAAFGTPAPYDTAVADGIFGDMVVATAFKNDGSLPAQSFFRKLTPGSSWLPLSALAPADAGWTNLVDQTVTPISIVGTGTLNGTRTGFIILPAALAAGNTGTLTASADIVNAGGSFQETFAFTNDATNPRRAVKFTLSDPVAAAFATGPTGSQLMDNGKTLLIPLQAGQTQVSVGLTVATALDRDRAVRITASASANANPFVPLAFAANEVTAHKI